MATQAISDEYESLDLSGKRSKVSSLQKNHEIRTEMCKLIFLSVTGIGMKATQYFGSSGNEKSCNI